ncbi:class I SAM-dependent methyltransferase [Streptomyces xanthophaeus]|uniref:class I SAM-dependent methyltransferase n=1 Tax=Streptomyces xanthophaeus TaxID=67385 RepID=UPI002647C0AF|nr:class I SAM-dependent methyltransferase [Streptomyces xanthophaeus]WKD34829.1 class I SAM-dependent methyltransferase [Streptomyces xanthophaeus]
MFDSISRFRPNPKKQNKIPRGIDTTQRQFETYKYLYGDAPSLSDIFDIPNRDAFEYCQRISHFVLIVPYTADHRILAERIFTREGISWSLLGDCLRQDEHEDFIVAANTITQETLPEVQLADIEPIAFLSNAFRHEGGEWIHNGIAFTARIRDDDVNEKLQRTKRTRAQLIDLETPSSSIAVLQNAEVLKLAQSYLESKGRGWIPFHDQEISRNARYRHRYQIHNKITKPIMRATSRYVCEHSLGEVTKKIDELVHENNPRSMIDVACGENMLCNTKAEKGDISVVVGNDISWSQIELIKQSSISTQPASSLIYTNHDATNLPFTSKAFSVAICKNVLHHMPSADAARKLIDECIRVSNRAVIIEVMDPPTGHLGSRVMYRYYLDFLKDAAVHFYSKREFEQLTENEQLSDRFHMSTIRGVYQFAVFDS